LINMEYSRRHGRVAGKNPWNADTLEWATDSPPEAYAHMHIPTVTTRHPLWDDHDEEYDPDDDRIFAEGRLTPVSHWVNAEPFAIAKMPKETISPLLLAIAVFGFFLAFAFQAMWWVLVSFVVMLILAGYWLWPREQGEEIG
ncbi:MAG TPA: hypothetical protein VMB49_05345, partial [Acidobacteriaceae bacterium]|nr:hypothetical protein [Acidobacteriaceae bacterium]